MCFVFVVFWTDAGVVQYVVLSFSGVARKVVLSTWLMHGRERGVVSYTEAELINGLQACGRDLLYNVQPDSS